MSDSPTKPVLRRQLLAEGWTDDELRRRRESGDLMTLQRGAYLEAGKGPPTPAHRHALRAMSGAALHAADGVLSHVTAAVLHGLPTWGLPLERVHRTRDRRSGGRVGEGTHLHVSPLEPDEVVTVDGLLVTSVARTVADVARTCAFVPALAVADCALRVHLIDGDELAIAVAHATGWPGAPAARRVLAFADPGSGSVGETRSRIAIHRAGLPRPELQWEVRSGSRVLGEADFGWPDLATVGEFDGKAKYGELRRPDQDPVDVLFAEKLREDAFRDLGLRVVRWTWWELETFDEVAARLRRAFAASTGR